MIDGETENHRYEFRAATVGYAYIWIVEFGKILDQTLKAQYVQDAFDKLETLTANESTNGNLIEFRLESYEFKNYRAYVSLKVRLTNDDVEVINNTYRSEGIPPGGKMFTGGPFAMKNATLRSTKSAIDDILNQFIVDLTALNS